MEGAKIVKEVQLKNFRSLKDTELQTLSPITLLVGENSSGKSSFLRAFPLLKQSIKKRTSGPILWSGDVDDYVDFGSFEETVTNDNSDQIKFRFKFDLDSLSRYHKFLLLDDDSENNIENIDFEITITTLKSKDYVAFFSLTINSFSVSFDILNGNIKFDENFEYTANKNLNRDNFNHKIEMSLPRFVSQKCHAFSFDLPNIDDLWNELSDRLSESVNIADMDFYLFRNVIGTMGRMLLRNKKIENLNENIDNKRYMSFKDDFLMYYNGLLGLVKEDIRLKNIIKLCYVYLIFPEIDDYILNYFRNVHYIAPLRATAERYYRLRNLAVDEVDYQGKNLAIFINSLSQKQIKDFNTWTSNHFGFSVSTGKSGGHLSLLIKLNNSDKLINLSDTGFGYSQVLPIITQLWELSTRHYKSLKTYYYDSSLLLPLVVAIEQPELHLHPAVQAKLAKAFIACIDLARKNGYQLQLLLETHSETIVNYLGKAVAMKKLNPEDVSIILFEKNQQTGVTTVRNSSYDNEGYLENWPYGFFNTED